MIELRRLSAMLACAGIALTAYLAMVGQFGPDPEFSQVDLTVSDYAVADRGGVTEWAMVLFGASGLAVMLALPRPPRSARVLLTLFATAMLVAAIAPTDEGPYLTTTGYLHRYASMVGFVALPTAGLLLARSMPGLPRRIATWTRGLAVASTTFMLAMLASATLADRALIGLAERLLLATGVALLGVLGGWSWRSSRLSRA